MSKWKLSFCRAVGLLWLCLAQTGEAGEGLGSCDFFVVSVWFGLDSIAVSVFEVILMTSVI